MTIDLFGEITDAEFKRVDGFARKTREAITLRINSPGGSVAAGLAILGTLQASKHPVRVEILGLAASMASVIAMAGRPVAMAENALFMIHNPWTSGISGDSRELRKNADLLDAMGKRLVSAYCKKTGLAPERVQPLMDAETWLDAAEAKALGFVDTITGPSAQARACGSQWGSLYPRIREIVAAKRAAAPAARPPARPLLEKMATLAPAAQAHFYQQNRHNIMREAARINAEQNII